MRHVPVLLTEVIESLQLKSGMNIIDCTLGDAGHSEKILEKISPNGKLLGIDADPEAILRAKMFLHQFENQIIFVRDNFVNLKQTVVTENFTPVSGILMDLGWSSPQFEERGRGFSFQNLSEPLDMRYEGIKNYELGIKNLTASELVNSLSEKELEKIFSEYGEEQLSREIAEAIIIERKAGKDFKTVSELVEVILKVYRQKLKSTKEIPWVGGLHPATKVFQALRIAVNDELGVLEKVLPQAIEVLATGGRLAVITFHSLEDRVVKHYFKSQIGKTLKLINKKPIIPTSEEVKSNSRSASAKLRVVEKI